MMKQLFLACVAALSAASVGAAAHASPAKVDPTYQPDYGPNGPKAWCASPTAKCEAQGARREQPGFQPEPARPPKRPKSSGAQSSGH